MARPRIVLPVGAALGWMAGCDGGAPSAHIPDVSEPQPTAEDLAPCDAVVAALEAGFAGALTRSARAGGCGVQLEAPRREGVEPGQLVRDAFAGWHEQRSLTAVGPEGERFTLEQGSVQCTTTFAWGPNGPRADVPWVVRVDCRRRPVR